MTLTQMKMNRSREKSPTERPTASPTSKKKEQNLNVCDALTDMPYNMIVHDHQILE